MTAGLGPAIHVFIRGHQRRGCPRQARAWRTKEWVKL